MGLNQKPNPTGVDKLINVWQKLLYDGLLAKGWLNYESYPRGYPNIDATDGNKVKAERFTDSIDYKGVLMDDAFSATSFFLVSGTGDNGSGLTESTVSVIFQADLKKLYPTSQGRFDEELINDIKTINRNLDGRFKGGAIGRTIDEVYPEFDTELIKEGVHNHEPYCVIRFDMQVTYQYSCSDIYASRLCTIGVTVSTTGSSGNDGTATANTTGAQAILSYLWTTSDGSIPAGQETEKTATGLTLGTYTVTVTDGLTGECTAQASGEVEVAATCDISVTVVVADETAIGANDGTASAFPSGGQGNLTYAWTTMDGNIPAGQEANQNITGLSGGTYTVIVTDDIIGSCTATDSGTIIEFTNLVLSIDPADKSTMNGAPPDPISGDFLSVITDASPEGNDLTAFAPDQPVVRNGHIEFVSEDFLSSSANSLIISGDLTMSLWFNTDSSGTQAIAGRWNAAGNRSFILDIIAGNWTLFVSPNGSTAIGFGSGVSATIGTWFYVCFQHDEINDLIKISATPESAVSMAPFVTAPHTTGLFAGTADFIYGKNVYQNTNEATADGLGGKLKVFNAVRTFSQCNDEFLLGH